MRLKFIIGLFVISFLLGFCSFAQGKTQKKEEPKFGWQNEMVGGLNLTQTSFDNWTQGGENSFAWQLNLNFKFVNDQEKFSWANSEKFCYDSTKTGDQKVRKSIDEIKLESVYTINFNFKLFYNKDISPKRQIKQAIAFGLTYSFL